MSVRCLEESIILLVNSAITLTLLVLLFVIVLVTSVSDLLIDFVVSVAVVSLVIALSITTNGLLSILCFLIIAELDFAVDNASFSNDVFLPFDTLFFETTTF